MEGQTDVQVPLKRQSVVADQHEVQKLRIEVAELRDKHNTLLQVLETMGVFQPGVAARPFNGRMSEDQSHGRMGCGRRDMPERIGDLAFGKGRCAGKNSARQADGVSTAISQTLSFSKERGGFSETDARGSVNGAHSSATCEEPRSLSATRSVRAHSAGSHTHMAAGDIRSTALCEDTKGCCGWKRRDACEHLPEENGKCASAHGFEKEDAKPTGAGNYWNSRKTVLRTTADIGVENGDQKHVGVRTVLKDSPSQSARTLFLPSNGQSGSDQAVAVDQPGNTEDVECVPLPKTPERKWQKLESHKTFRGSVGRHEGGTAEMGKSRGPQAESSQHEWHCGGGWRDTVKQKNGMDGKGRTSDDMGARDRYFRFVRDWRSGAHFNDTCHKGRSHGSQFDDPKGGRSWKSARRCVI